MPGVIKWEPVSSGECIPDQLFGVGGDNGTVIWCQNPELASTVSWAMNEHEASEDLELLLNAAEVAMATEGEVREQALGIYQTLKERYQTKAFRGH